MNRHFSPTVPERLSRLDQQIRRRTALVTIGYSLGFAGAIALYVFFPFQLSRAGSVVLIVALAHMIWKVYEAGRGPRLPDMNTHNPLVCDLSKVEAQIRLVQSVIHNLPFLVGANLFFMGLPGTGSAESKAWLDCYFLFGTTILFAAFYIANQRMVRKELLPLRQELENLLPVSREDYTTRSLLLV